MAWTRICINTVTACLHTDYTRWPSNSDISISEPLRCSHPTLFPVNTGKWARKIMIEQFCLGVLASVTGRDLRVVDAGRVHTAIYPPSCGSSPVLPTSISTIRGLVSSQGQPHFNIRIFCAKQNIVASASSCVSICHPGKDVTLTSPSIQTISIYTKKST